MSDINPSLSRRDALLGMGAMTMLPLLQSSVLADAVVDAASGTAAGEPATAAAYRGKWYGDECYVGYHYDVHVIPSDKNIGANCNPKEIVEMLKLAGADFVETDSKGHPGMTSWFSKTPDATVGPGVVKDWVQAWSEAAKELGIPLHCHYSGVYDVAAGMKHPEWCIIGADGNRVGDGWNGLIPNVHGDRMCPRSPYVDKLMIPQMIELMDRYGANGFWIDGDTWCMVPCYCERCRSAFKEKTGIAEPPKNPGEPHWVEWWKFQKESYEEYATRYCDAVHKHKPGALIAIAGVQNLNNPGEPKIPVDFLSGDNYGGIENGRILSRFLSTRGKPWDVMLWVHYSSHDQLGRVDWAMKPAEMLQQEAAHVLAFGGNIQTCENPFNGLRDGRLVAWRNRRIGEMAKFAKARRELCQNSETIPQIAVIHSEEHACSTPGAGLLSTDCGAAVGAVQCLLECHYGVDILDEWKLLPRLSQFSVVVASEEERMSQKMVDALKKYVEDGGKLLVAGVAMFDRFGEAFLGVKGGTVAPGVYYLPADDGVVPINTTWRLVEPAGAETLFRLGNSLLPEDRSSYPAATIHSVGKGFVAYIPYNIFREFSGNRFPPVRIFLHNVVRAMTGKMAIEVTAPTCIDVALRRKGTKQIVHLLNRSPGTSNLPHACTDGIPQVGPFSITMTLPKKPKNVSLAFEDAAITWSYAGGGNPTELKIEIPSVHIHAAVVVEEDA